MFSSNPWGHSTVLTNLTLKANILIDETGQPRLADFGLLKITSDPANIFSSSSNSPVGTVRWMSPELISPQEFGCKKSRPTRSSDCYALGMVIYETISGKLPFYKYTDYMVFLKVTKGERPSREARFSEGLWEMLERCWTPYPEDRPRIKDILWCLGVAPTSSGTLSLDSDEEIEMGSDDWGSSSSSSDEDGHTATTGDPSTLSGPDLISDTALRLKRRQEELYRSSR